MARGSWRKKPAIGLGLGVGLLGAVVLAVRYGMHRAARMPIPDTISPAIFATRVCQTSHGEIVYHTSGAGDPLVFLHGIYPGASSYEWSRVYPEFAIGHEVIAPDLVGFGESERPRRGLDADDHVRALADLLYSICGNRHAVIVASGFGAAIALKLSVQHPEMVSRLILFAPVGLDSELRRMPFGMSALVRVPVLNLFVYRNYFARKPFLRGWLTRIGFADPARVTDEIVDVFATCASQYGAEHAMFAFLRGRLLYDVRTQLPRVTQAVTVLWPDLPERFPQEFPARLQRAIPHCRIVSAGAVGATGALEAPDVLLKLIESELAGGDAITSVA